MSDFDEMVDEFFPGSKRKRRDPRPVPEKKVRDYGKPKVYKVNGEDVEFFTISAVAEALDREIVTVRMWISNGVLPEARYKLPPRGQNTFGAKGGQRLWTRAQIDAIGKIAEEEGLLDPVRNKKIADTSFTKRVVEAMR